MTLAIAIVALLLAGLPTVMLFANLPLFCVLRASVPPSHASCNAEPIHVSILIPARDEQSGIADCIESALSSSGVTVEVVVLDDDSQDATAAIVNRFCETDPRVRLIHGKSLPADWNGKQHACKQLADAAVYERMIFIDADVRLKPDAICRLVHYQNQSAVGLLSAFPHQVTGTWLEQWMIPLMHFILLGYLPFARMRTHSDPSLAAGCGQLFLTTRESYEQSGTHAAIRQSRHDGVKLPRAYRVAGFMTDVVDGTELAECRMYRGAAEVTRGLLKNAIEGIANPRLIVVFTLLLLGCSLLPIIALLLSVAAWNPLAIGISLLAVGVAHLPRCVTASRLRQSWFGALCHVPALILFVALQWIALLNHLLGRKIAWRGRSA